MMLEHLDSVAPLTPIPRSAPQPTPAAWALNRTRASGAYAVRPRPDGRGAFEETPMSDSPALLLDANALTAQLQADPAAAFAVIRDAAQAGQVAAQLLLAQMHMEGKGTARDEPAALLWYETAANNGSPLAMNMLGRCHELGHATAPNHELAAVWYAKAADAGLDWGMYNHANLLATGRGVAKGGRRAHSLVQHPARGFIEPFESV